MSTARKIFDLIGSLVILAGIAGGVYYFREDLNNLWRQSAAEFLPCSVPIRYSLNQFDDKFGMSKPEFLDVVDRAAQSWSKAANKPLFEYSEGGELGVNLIYDYRQEATDKLKGMGLNISSGQDSYNELKVEYKTMKSKLESKQATYETRVVAFQRRAEKYEGDVESWNQKGGAPKKIYERLDLEKQNLDSVNKSLKAESDEINNDVDDLNAVVTVLNRIASNLNLEADQFNQTAGARGETFQEGEYSRDSDGTRINIFEFEDQTMLLRVLIHEFGHALGLGHLPDERAIMYELNLGKEHNLSDTDKAAIQEHCR